MKLLFLSIILFALASSLPSFAENFKNHSTPIKTQYTYDMFLTDLYSPELKDSYNIQCAHEMLAIREKLELIVYHSSHELSSVKEKLNQELSTAHALYASKCESLSLLKFMSKIIQLEEKTSQETISNERKYIKKYITHPDTRILLGELH